MVWNLILKNESSAITCLKKNDNLTLDYNFKNYSKQNVSLVND